MEDTNIKWEPGDVAICKVVGKLYGFDDQGIPPPLRLNAEYIVNAVNICGDCGVVKLDVGLNSMSNVGTRCNCGARSKPSDIHWANATRFVKKKTRADIMAQIAEAEAKEDYSLAAALQRDLKDVS